MPTGGPHCAWYNMELLTEAEWQMLLRSLAVAIGFATPLGDIALFTGPGRAGSRVVYMTGATYALIANLAQGLGAKCSAPPGPGFRPIPL